MNQKLYALYDLVAEQFGPVFQAVNHQTAIRTVQNMRISAYEDFELFYLGEWNMESGEMKVLDTKGKIEWITPTFLNAVKAEKNNAVKGVLK